MVHHILRIVQVSDTHIAAQGQFVPEMFARAVEKINGLEPAPDMIIHSGDLTDNGVLADYELAVEKLKELKVRPIVVPGNHDQKNFGQSLFAETVGDVDYKVMAERTTVFLLNSPQPDRDDGRMGRRRLEYLGGELANLDSERFKVVVFHHHLVPVPYSGRESNVLEDAGEVLDLLLRNHVHLVLMGHRHVRRVLKIDGTVLVNSGTLSSVRTRGRFGHSFNVIDLYEDGSMKIMEENLTTGRQIPLASLKRSEWELF